MEANSRSGAIYTKDQRVKGRIGMENPFSFKMCQVFTGFGIGCGLGIGIGRPVNLGAIPVLKQVMVATSGAIDAFSGGQRHLNNSLRKVGVKNIEMGIGCGVGFGHGFGIGIAMKPRVVHQLQSSLQKALMGVIMKFGMGPILSEIDKDMLPAPLQTGVSMVEKSSYVTARESTNQVVQPVSDHGNYNNTGSNQSPISLTKYNSQTEAVLDNFLKSSVLKEENSPHEQAGLLQGENNLLQMVLKHQLLIDELMRENEKLRQILMEELKVEQKKFQSSFTSRSKSVCDECFECRRKQRRR